MGTCHRGVWLAMLSIAVAAHGDPPATQPSAPATQPATQPQTRDDDMDWMLGQARPASAPPADLPASRAATPFDQKTAFTYRRALVVFSDGEKFHGPLRTTLDKPVRVWVEEDKQYHDIPFALIKTIEASVVWEREEAEWHFKESGSDIKEFTGKSYPAREMRYTLTLLNGQSLTGGVVAPLYVQTIPGQEKTLVLHKRDKGDPGQTLKDLIYVQRVEFED